MDNLKKIGRYEVVSVMGQGAMGTVYKAVDPVIERVVAIKTINLELSREERAEFEERFYREAKSAGRLSHPNIVTIYDVGETGEAAYIAMEYVEGESLRDVLDSGVVLPIRRICQIVARVAGALNYAHENGVVHRDIKPANIMILGNRDVKIMDFGIALIPTGSRTQAGTVLGSPKYMAPEQLAGRPTDGRADIFSLGAVLYEMLTDATPFNGDNLSAIMYKILNDEPAMPSKLNARVPPELDRIVAKALAKRPEDRYQKAQELARDLKAYEARAARDGHDPGTSGRPAHKPADAQPLDAQTELLLPRASDGRVKAARPPRQAALSRRNLVLLGIPLLTLAAYAMLQPARQPHATEAAGTLAQLPANPPAERQEAPPPAPARKAAAPAPARAPSASLPRAGQADDTTEMAAAPASLSFAITPWGEVFIDGKRAGISPPLARLELDAGAHRIEIRNGTYASHHATVNLDSGESLKIKHKFK